MDGRIDELKVFNSALGPNEIEAFYDLGVQQNNPDVVTCEVGTISAQFKIGASGSWQTGNVANVNIGDEVYIRANVATDEEYFVTLPFNQQNTFSSIDNFPNFEDTTSYKINTFNGGNGRIENNNLGQYALTTASGCTAVIDVRIAGDCNLIEQEYRINGVWQSGAEEITLDEGDELVLSILPNGIDVTITLPNGSFEQDNYNLGNVTLSNSGNYTFTTADGCTKTLTVNIGTDETLVCNDIFTQYSINGLTSIQGTEVNLEEGDDITLSLFPDGVEYEIISPEGLNLDGNSLDGYTLTDISKSQEGDYTFITQLSGSGANNPDISVVFTDSEEVDAEDGRAINVLDGNSSTIWHTRWSGNTNDSQPHEIQFDLGGTFEINGLTYLPRQDNILNGTIVQYEVYISDNTNDWGNPLVQGNWVGDNSLKTINFQTTLGQYVRLVSLAEINGEAWASASEITISTTEIIQDCEKIMTITVESADPDGLLSVNDVGEVVSSYAPGSQDNGSHEVLDGGGTLRMTGNSWKKVPLSYEITSGTVLEFDLRVTGLGEIHGIGFDNDNTLESSDAVSSFQLAGTQNYGNQDFRTYGGSDWVSFSIPVGQYFTGGFAYLVFAGDKDSNANVQDSSFRNIVLREVSPVAVSGIVVNPQELTLSVGAVGNPSYEILPSDATDRNVSWSVSDDDIASVDQNGRISALSIGETTITVTTDDGGFIDDIIVTFESADPDGLLSVNDVGEVVSSYAPGSQDNGSHEVLDGGGTLRMTGNSWKKVPLSYEITSGTVLEFDLRVTGLGEIHGIGFDNDNTLESSDAVSSFQLAGTQNYGNQDFRTYGGSDWVSFSIPVGQYFTGGFAYLVFAGDKDSNANVQDSSFRNIVLRENTVTSKTLSLTNDTKILSGGIQENDIIIYPNPTEGIINIDLSMYLGTAITIDIINSAGQSMIKVVLDENHETVASINLDSLIDGIYYVIVDGEIGKTSRSVVLLKK
ncbi:T9SS type A sorting domain-containing protein [Maribacter sp. MJ134]|uniref:discoidin domain-containing protein n=1 Tax=Maribacter sp. MJ134 TaxID=2496865 RepID=UPI000F815F43|nr:discoidin domain-containing protein [Maribacter sp. MJ134]AZQ57685.1 T9SS type A sorting domain-containing protein [Maribacter sp. MJ134]